ncbi:unnamed protein product [Musa hybrid cultivar]
MEEEKAAAYYDELSRKGEGAARFKQGLGFSSSSTTTSNSDRFPSKPKTSSSSLFSTFIRASSPNAKPPDEQHSRQARLEVIQNKLNKERRHHDYRRSLSPSPDRDRRRRRSSRDRDDRRSPSSSPDRNRRRRRSRDRDDRRSGDRRRRSPSRESRREPDGRGSSHRGRGSRDRDEDSSHSRSRRRSWSRSPRRESRGADRERKGGHEKERGGEKHRSARAKNGGGVDYSQLIEGYSNMTPAERVKAKMKLQLSETVAKDTDRGMGSGWERFDFNKEAPLDDDDEIEAADDDASLVKNIEKSFRYSAVEAKREEEIKAAHDNAMFGASAACADSPVLEMESVYVDVTEDASDKTITDSLVSDKLAGSETTQKVEIPLGRMAGARMEPARDLIVLQLDLLKKGTDDTVADKAVWSKVYPLFAAVGVAVGICGFQLIRNLCINPEVRINKEGRAAGVLENYAEGEKYAEHSLRRFVRNRNPEIMPAINSFFTNPSK